MNNIMRSFTTMLALLLIVVLPLASMAQALQAVHLRCNYSVDPLGVADKTPMLSWELLSSKRNVVQAFSQVLVADDSLLLNKNLGNVWDSKKRKSTASVNVVYAGKSLQPAKKYYWKVKVWDNNNQVSDWSAVGSFQMGLLSQQDWKNAQWIAYEKLADSNVNVLPVDGKPDKYNGNNVLPLIRKSFTAGKKIKNATAFVSGLGHFELYINGAKTSDHFLDAGWTKYDKEALYVTYDVTRQLQQGENAIGVMLGNGFYYVPPVKGRFRKLRVAYGYPKMICRILVQYEDGSSENIVSDHTWKTTVGPITFSSIYGGEDYDANLEKKGWDNTGYNDADWKQAIVVQGPPTLKPQAAEPLKVMEQFTPISATLLANGDWVYDLGQNASGIISVELKGKKGDTVRFTPGELLAKEGGIAQKHSGSPYYFEYVLKGDGIEKWQPQFTYYGFRYVQVKGATDQSKANTDKPSLLSIKLLHTRNAAADAGDFASSNELFNKTDTLIKWAMKSNMASVLTDCPHREKLGWLEQAHLMWSSVNYNYDAASLFSKVVDDMIASQLDNGLIPEIAPEYVHFTWGGTMFRDSPEWGSSGILVPWYMYQWYGDKQVLSKAYPVMQRYIQYLQTQAKDNILSQGLGDWYDLGPNPPGVSQLTPMGVTGTAIYYYDLVVMQKIAAMLGKTADIAAYKKLAGQVKTSFNDKFFNSTTRQYATASQTANAMAIYMRLVPEKDQQAILANLVKSIEDSSYRLTAGDIGYRYVLQVLEKAGRSDVIYKMNNRSDVPGYGYQLAKGATALTESWQALPTVSNNHFMLGHLMEWFYSGLAGIRQQEGGIAFKTFDIAPQLVGDISHAKASYKSPYGLIESSWKLNDDLFELEVTVPANTTATIYLPKAAGKRIAESGKAIQPLRFTPEGQAVITVGSGKYHYEVKP